jgi:hypothetical protein
MKTLLLTAPEKPGKPDRIRKLMRGEFSGWRIATIPSRSLGQSALAPDVTVVEIDEDTKPAQVRSMIPDLVHMQSKGPQPSCVVFSLKEYPKAKSAEARAQQRHYQKVIIQITGSLPAFPNPQLVDVTFASSPSAVATLLEHVRAKRDLQVQQLDVHLPKAQPQSSRLDDVRELLKATENLRLANGKLSATAVAKAFGVSVNELAGWLKRSRQSVTKTPDADSLQNDLAFFERVARLRAVVPQQRFLKWLRMPHDLLDGKTPLELMAEGERQVVVDFVEDMLTGAPT